jgi:shikimate kinase
VATGPIAVLIGAPGAGKTTIGRRTAERLHVPFADSDHLVEHATGKKVADIFVESGESEFRRLEAEAIAEALNTFTGVLSLGGGAVMNPSTREVLTGQTVIWLDVDLSNAAQRVGLNAARPLLMGNVRATLSDLMKQRTPVYQELATATIDTSGRSIRLIVDEVVAQIESVGAARGNSQS